jgi:hypothetical protein
MGVKYKSVGGMCVVQGCSCAFCMRPALLLLRGVGCASPVTHILLAVRFVPVKDTHVVVSALHGGHAYSPIDRINPTKELSCCPAVLSCCPAVLSCCPAVLCCAAAAGRLHLPACTLQGLWGIRPAQDVSSKSLTCCPTVTLAPNMRCTLLVLVLTVEWCSPGHVYRLPATPNDQCVCRMLFAAPAAARLQ